MRAPPLLWCALGAIAVSGAHAKELELSIGDVQGAGFSARSVRATLSGAKLRELALEVGALEVAGRPWRKVKLACAEVDVSGARIACPRGTLDTGDKTPVSFSYSTDTRNFTVELKPGPEETLRATGQAKGAQSVIDARIEKTRLDRLAPWLPAGFPKMTGGIASGTLALQGGAARAKVDVSGLAFSDASGLHAGEKIAATVEADAAVKGGEWRWNARIGWKAGEVFWQPVFAAAKGQQLHMAGTTSGPDTHVREGRLDLPGIGVVAFTAQWNHAKNALVALDARTARLRVGALYDDLLKSVLQGTALADLRAEGEASVTARMSGSDFRAVDAELNGISFEDRQRRFALFGMTGKIAWRPDEWSPGELAFKGAEFLKLPIGAAKLPLRLRGSSIALDNVRIPVLDGALVIKDFRAGTTDLGWRWRFSGELTPLSMAQVSQATGLPTMHGSLGGVIPDVRYRRGTLAMDGALLVRAFDGTITATQVQLIEPFGRAPRLLAEVEMKNLDLDLLTRTFDFGSITGRIDAQVKGLEMVNWQPVHFDARLQSSPGQYPRKISQRAVQNISALGGETAAAAIQRTFLRFFDQFGYEKLGLSCRLANGVCQMDGIERAPQGYVIVKGGGVPAISVIGYNRDVDWRELVERLKRITEKNVKAIVK